MKPEKFSQKTFNMISLYRGTDPSACCYSKALYLKVIGVNKHLEMFRELLAPAL